MRASIDHRQVSPFHRPRRPLGRVQVQLYSILDLCTGRGEGSASRPGRTLPPGNTQYPLYRRLGGHQGRSGQVRKISLHGDSIRGPSNQQSVATPTTLPTSIDHVCFTLSQATKVLRQSRGIALFYFRPLHQKGVRGQHHAPAAAYPPERPGTHCKEGWVGLRAGLDRCGKSRPHRDSIPGPSNPQAVAIPTTLPTSIDHTTQK